MAITQHQEEMIKAYMNIFNMSREDAVAALRARGLLEEDSAAEDEKIESLMKKRGVSRSKAIAFLKANGGISKSYGTGKKKKKDFHISEWSYALVEEELDAMADEAVGELAEDVRDQMTDDIREEDRVTIEEWTRKQFEDAKLSSEKRKKLKSSTFCGPDRSFPVPDCAHVTAARRLIGRAKGLSESQKKSIMSCVNGKAKKLGCDKKKEKK